MTRNINWRWEWLQSRLETLPDCTLPADAPMAEFARILGLAIGCVHQLFVRPGDTTSVDFCTRISQTMDFIIECHHLLSNLNAQLTTQAADNRSHVDALRRENLAWKLLALRGCFRESTLGDVYDTAIRIETNELPPEADLLKQISPAIAELQAYCPPSATDRPVRRVTV